MAIVRVVDFETTGTEPPAAEVCEVGICDVDGAPAQEAATRAAATGRYRRVVLAHQFQEHKETGDAAAA